MWLLFYACLGKPFLYIEARASLGRKFIMTVHCRPGVFPEQLFDKFFKCYPLSRCPGVFRRLAVRSTATYQADAY